MHVLMINGSPNEHGCTATALAEVAGQLVKAGIEARYFQIGNRAVHDCIGCGRCASTSRCIFTDDPANDLIEQASLADGIIVGSPVYYAGPSSALCALLDRMFYLKSGRYAFKPAAAVLNCRRGGASAAFDRLNKYFTISNMPVVPSQYWNATHGLTPDEVRRDTEGLQVMRTLGRNMAWMLKCIEAAQGIVPYPEREKRITTNFIRADLT
jgi:multimeric flavodoxin WrbA